MANAISSIPSGGGTLVYNRFPEINGFTVLPKDTPIIISSYGDDKGLLYVDADGTSTLNNIVYTVYDVRGYDGSFLGYIGTLDSSIIINAQTIGRIEMEF